MARPSLRVKHREFTTQIDQLLLWDTSRLSTATWIHRLNELRFVRATLAWEDFLEQSFICYLRGSQSILGQAYALAGNAALNVADAQARAIGNNQLFGRWLNEVWTLNRATALFNGPHPYQALASPTFPVIRRIRNRIVHRSDNVRAEFRIVIMGIYGSYRPGLSPGRLLTENEHGSSRIENYLNLLKATATLIAN